MIYWYIAFPIDGITLFHKSEVILTTIPEGIEFIHSFIHSSGVNSVLWKVLLF